MNKLITIFIGLFAFVLVNNQEVPLKLDEGTQAHIEFETTNHDFGKMTQGGDGTYSFVFTNTGKEPLIIQNVQSSCGCTVAKRPTEPILPGESSQIAVKYDTRRLGVFHKNITVTSNADNASVVLFIKGEISAKPVEELPVKEANEGFTPTAQPAEAPVSSSNTPK